MSKSTREILEGMRELISKPGAWTQGANARNADGISIFPLAPAASCYCLHGALVCAFGSYPVPEADEIAMDLLDSAARDAGCEGGFIAYNDAEGRTQAEVVGLIDAALGLLEEQG